MSPCVSAQESSSEQAAYVELKGLTDFVYSTVFSPDGKKVVTESDGTAQIWDAETGKELKKLKGTFAVFSPDGKKVVTTISATAPTGDNSGRLVLFLEPLPDETTARIWDAETGDELLKLKAEFVRFAILSPDGKKIVTRSGSTTQIWDAETGEELRELEGGYVVFSPDGKKIVTSDNGTTQIWDAETGEELRKLKGKDAVFSPDGKKIVTRSDDAIRICDTETGEELQKLEAYTSGDYAGSYFKKNSFVRSAVFSPDSEKVITASSIVCIWDAVTGKELRRLKAEFVRSAILSPDGKKIVTSSDSTTQIWDAETGEELRELEGGYVAISPSGRKASGYAALSPDGKKIVTVSKDGTIRIWDLPTIEKQVADVKEAEAKRVAEHTAFLAQTGAVDLDEELSKSGFDSLIDFLQFGSTKLKDDLQKADAFDKIDVEEKIMAAQEDIAKKTFYGEYTFSAFDVKVAVDQSSFTMRIPAGFITPKIGEVVFPMSGVTVNSNLARRLTAPINRGSVGILMGEVYAFLLKDDKILPVIAHGNKDNDTFNAYLPAGGNYRELSNSDLKNAVHDTHGTVLYTRHGNPSSIVLSVNGSTDGIREIVRNSGDYRARVWFKNMRYSKETKGVEYWLTNTYWRKDADVDDKRYSNPFVTNDKEVVETISADALKIEIIKK